MILSRKITQPERHAMVRWWYFTGRQPLCTQDPFLACNIGRSHVGGREATPNSLAALFFSLWRPFFSAFILRDLKRAFGNVLYTLRLFSKWSYQEHCWRSIDLLEPGSISGGQRSIRVARGLAKQHIHFETGQQTRIDNGDGGMCSLYMIFRIGLRRLS